MKTLYLLLLVVFVSCGVDEVVTPPKVDCPHTITIQQGEREDIVKVCITSDLPEVWVTVQGYPRTKVIPHYYACRSWHVAKDELLIKIEAEEVCEYIY